MRKCGECQLCCRVMPILEIGKPANKRCANQKFGTGCKVHGTAAQPESCRRWSCWWLMNPTFDFPRPDRAGYIVDPTPDFVVFGDDVFKGRHVPALQIWADPSRPEAWRRAMAWIKEAVEPKGAVAVVRFNEREAVVIVPLALSGTGRWEEQDTRVMKPHTADTLRRKDFEEKVAAAMEESSSVQEGLSSSPNSRA